MYDIKIEFLYSIQTLKDSNEKSFKVNLENNKSILIAINKAGCDWVNYYKHNIYEAANKLQKKIAIDISKENFRFIFYFYTFILPDILIIKNILKDKFDNILDIGGGIGLFNIFLDQTYKNLNIDIIEVEKLIEIEHHNNKKSHILQKPLHVIELLKKFLSHNKIQKLQIINSLKIHQHENKRYDYIFSFRSWCFLYDIDEYLSFVNKTLKNDGVVIADVLINSKNNEKFRENFKKIKILQSYKAHERLIGYR